MTSANLAQSYSLAEFYRLYVVDQRIDGASNMSRLFWGKSLQIKLLAWWPNPRLKPSKHGQTVLAKLAFAVLVLQGEPFSLTSDV
jgi:hypothetical protein